MKHIKHIFALCLLSMVIGVWNFQSAQAQSFPVDTILKSGSLENRINLVFLPDGYQTGQLNDFSALVQDMVDSLFNTTPYKEYQNYFNIFAIRVPSNESGADHPQTANDENFSQPILVTDTYFDCTFDFGGIHRLILPKQSSKMYSVLQASFPMYDEIMVVSNSPYYGGAATGSYANVTAHPAGVDVVIHELGHSFASLGDEYNGTRTYCGERWNITAELDPTKIKWKHWIEPGTVLPTTYDPADPNKIGAFEGAGVSSTGCFRPRYRCKMRTLGPDFCQVCVEQTVISTHNAVSSIDSYSPANLDITAGPNTTTNFSVDLVEPNPNTLYTEWVVNGVVQATGTNTYSFTTGNEICGYQVKVLIYDSTALARKPLPRDSVIWILDDIDFQVTGPDTIICRGDSVQLSANGGVTYTWSPSLWLSCTDCPNPIANPYFTTTYTVTAIDANGCYLSDEITVNVNSLSAFVSGPRRILIGWDDNECATLNAFAFGGEEPYSYSWSTGETTQSIEVCPTETTNYILTVTDALGCSVQYYTFIQAIDVRCGNEENNGNNEEKIEICHTPVGGGNCESQCLGFSSIQTHLNHGDYIGPCRPCGIIFFNGEEVEGAGGFGNFNPPSELLIDDHQLAGTIKAVPNPFNEHITISLGLSNDADTRIWITDMTGKQVAVFEPGFLSQGTHRFHWDGHDANGNHLANGVYILNVKMGDNLQTERIMMLR